MASRLQVDTGLRPQSLTPIASPVDTFTKPTAGQGLAQLANGLAAFAPSLARFSGELTDRHNTEKRTEGEAAARRMFEAGKSYADAVKEGLIPRGANPFYVAGFKEQWGRVTADKWNSDLTVALANNPDLQTSTDLKDYDKFVAEHRKDWLEKNVDPGKRDQFFETGFGHRADAYYANARNSFASQMAQRIEKYSDDAHFAEVKQHVLSSKASPEVIAEDIDILNESLVRQGRDGTALNQTTVKAIVSAALDKAQAGDPNALKVLDLITQVNGKSGPLSNTQFGAGAMQKAREDVSNLLWQSNERERKTAADLHEKQVMDVFSQAWQDLASDRHADLTKYISKLGGDPKAVTELASLQRNANLLTFTTDEETKKELFSRIWNDGGVDPVEITSWANRGKLSTEDASWLIGQINSRETMIRQGSKQTEFSDFMFKTTLSGIDDAFRSEAGAIFGTNADRARYARALLMDAWVRHIGQPENANEDLNARGLWLKETADRIVGQMRQGGITPDKVPQPDFDRAGVDPYTTKILTPESLKELRDAIQHGNISPSILKQMQTLGIRTPEDIAKFFRAQMELVGGGTQSQTPPKQP